MKIKFHKNFVKNFKKRIKHYPKLAKSFETKQQLFIIDRKNPQLRDHALAGDMLGFRSFSITGDIRVIYTTHNNVVYFVDIGSHNQVYN